MRKLFLVMLVGIFMFSLVNAVGCENPGLPNAQQIDIETQLIQTCTSCTYVNISSITSPNSTEYINEQMTETGTTYNYSYTPNQIGNYFYSVIGNKDGSINEETLCFEVSHTGEGTNTTQGFVLIAQIGVVALLFGFGRIFDKKKWKIKMLFDMMAALMGLVLINSLKIVSAQSGSLNTMGEMAFYIGMVIVSFLFLYLFINATLELVEYFKLKKKKKWRVDFYND